MIYRIVCDGIDIYGDTVETSVLNPHLEIELNSAGSLEFTLPKNNGDPWDLIGVFKNEIEVWENDEIIWFGRPLQITRDWNNQKKVVCEGALAYFNDTLERTNEIKPSNSHTNVWFFNELIESYNSQIEIDHQGIYPSVRRPFTVGDVSIDPVPVYRKTDYQTTLECLQQMCLDTDGGYFILRKEYNPATGVATRYIDWVESMPYGSSQDVTFGVNLLDVSQDLNGSDVCTVLVPVGSNDLYLNNLGDKDPYAPENKGVGHEHGSDEIYFIEGIKVYGRILKVESFGDYDTKESLWLKACDWLSEKNKDIQTIEVDAADLHYIKGKEHLSNFKVGMRVQVTSGVHDLDQELIIYKLSMDLDSGVKKVTLGTPPKKELTDIVAPSSGGGSTRGTGGSGNSGDGGSSGSSGSTYIPVKDVQVKAPGADSYSSVVSKKIAKIDLSDLDTDGVKDVTVDGVTVVDPETKIANIVSEVKDVSVNGVSVVDPATKIADISVTEVEANPSETSEVSLEAIKIGDDIYNINNNEIAYGNLDPNVEEGEEGDIYFKLGGEVTPGNYRYIKFAIEESQSGTVNCNVCGFYFLDGSNNRMSWPSGTTVTCDVVIYGEPGYLLVDDGNHAVMSSNGMPTFIITLPQGSYLDISTYNSYMWKRMFDSAPKTWKLYLSVDGENWKLIDNVNGYVLSGDGYSGSYTPPIIPSNISDIYIKTEGSWIKDNFSTGGGSGSGGQYICDLLFKNDPMPSPTSGTSTVSRTYNLSHSINSYDAIVVHAFGQYTTSVLSEGGTYVILKEDYDIGNLATYRNEMNYDWGTAIKKLAFAFPTEDTILTESYRTNSGNEPILYTVYGLKFNTTIFSPEIYSEEEREIGVWTDGKPLYQKTEHVVLTNPVEPQTDTTIQLFELQNRDKLFYTSVIGGFNGVASSISNWTQFITDANPNSASAAAVKSYADNEFIIWVGSNHGNFPQVSTDNRYRELYVTRQYTKTTDTPGSAHWLPGGTIAANYDTSEQIVGQWMGQTLYQKTIRLQNQSMVSKRIEVDISSLNPQMAFIVYDGSCAYDSYNSQWQSIDFIPGHANMNYSLTAYAVVTQSSAYVEICSPTDYGSRLTDIYVTIQYTKTTDTPGSSSPTILATQAELEAMADHFQDGVDAVYDACVSKGSTPASHALADVVDAIENINGITQINPFPQGASTLTLYNSNGISINSSSIDANGTATMDFNESSAGYEGFVIELNVIAGKIYLVEFDYQNISASYFSGNYVLGWLLENSARTSYSSWQSWPNNISRDADKHALAQAIIPTGTKIYMNFNVCGYSDSRTNNAKITNLKVLEIPQN